MTAMQAQADAHSDGQETTNEPLSAALTPDDLAELLGRFNEVTTQLQGSHERLNREVHRLRAELRHANEELARSKRLAALGEMAAGIAHEIRNPLGSIGLYARLLDDDLRELPDSRETAQKIGRAVRGLEAIVQDVLSFAREIRVRRDGVCAGDLFGATLEAVGPSLLAGVSIERRGAEVMVEGDFGLLKQAMVNLVRNAAEAMADRLAEDAGAERRLTLAARVLRSGRPVLRVRDTGPGIGEEALDRMFNPFYTTRASGTGLGLAIVHRILDAHGGTVKAKNNTPGPGATVELRLPAARELVGPGGLEQEQAA